MKMVSAQFAKIAREVQGNIERRPKISLWIILSPRTAKHQYEKRKKKQVFCVTGAHWEYTAIVSASYAMTGFVAGIVLQGFLLKSGGGKT